MQTLSTEQAARILRELLKFIRKEINANPQFTVTNLMTLLSAVEHPGALQTDLRDLAGVDDAVLSRQLRYLQGKAQGVVQSKVVPLVRLDRNNENSKFNDVFLTPEGIRFAKDFGAFFNRLLKQASSS